MKIPIVNEQDEIIGEEERKIIHQNGLKHREIHVWLVTPNQEFIFQKRGDHQDTWPGFYDVTVGGHVDTKYESYQECAQRELLEETGIKVTIKFIEKQYRESFDPNTKTQNNAFRCIFAGICEGNLEEFKIEEGAGLGFRKFSLEEIKNFSEEMKGKVIPRFYSDDYFEMYNKIIKELF
ncbi:MAG: NUDIX domain-containing protein [Candidatus Paceibacterota bacterium]